MEVLLLGCPNCGTLRIFEADGTISCPTCNKWNIIGKAAKLKELNEQIFKVKKYLKKILKKVSLTKFKLELLKMRDDLAYNIAENIQSNHFKLKNWFMCNLLIEIVNNLIYSQSNKESVLIDELQNKIFKMAENLYHLKTQISLLKFDKIIYILDGASGEKIYKTEKHPITSIPEVFKDDAKDDESKRLLFEDGFFFDFQFMIESERFSRYLKQYYNERLLPFLKPANVELIYFILELIINNAPYLIKPFYVKDSKIHISQLFLSEFMAILRTKFSKKQSAWFIKNMVKRGTAHSASFNFFDYDSSKNSILIPYPSLSLIQTAVYKHLKISKIGQDSNLKGKILEDLIFDQLKIFELNLKHPHNKTELKRVPHYEKLNEEIADVMGYNDKYIILIESKYWNTPLLKDLEEEIEKFNEKCDYIQENLSKFGLKNPKSILKIFYTPFAPYQKWRDIKLFPSFPSILYYLSKKLPRKKFFLFPENSMLNELIEMRTEFTPYAIDAHELNSKFDKDKYRIQDAIILSIDENEVRLSLLNPHGRNSTVYCKINPEIYKKLIKKKVRKASWIKCGIANLSISWNYLQLMYFKPITYDPLYLEIIEIYRDNKLVPEVYKVFKKHQFNLQKLLSCWKRKNENVSWGMGFVLLFVSTKDIVVQCDCGEIIGYDPGQPIYLEIQKMYPDGKIKCKYCDPYHKKKLELIAGGTIYRINLLLTDFDFKKLIFHGQIDDLGAIMKKKVEEQLIKLNSIS